jgi:hypothetical protein
MYWYVEPKKEHKDNSDYSQAIIIVTDLKMENGSFFMMYKHYDLETGKIGEKEPSKISDWNFKEYNFFILNKEEASPYIKKMIVDSLIEKQE